MLHGLVQLDFIFHCIFGIICKTVVMNISPKHGTEPAGMEGEKVHVVDPN